MSVPETFERAFRCPHCEDVTRTLEVDGVPVLVDRAEIKRDLEPGLIALNPRTRGTRVVTSQDMFTVQLWVRGGAKFYRRHDQRCPNKPEETPDGN